ncbi:beta-lactamase/transpeptidase-like protein [Delphinella strobiligena]|nr:beta-lactamase/transpeptidase-like protein [Delphinella strobiligena]
MFQKDLVEQLGLTGTSYTAPSTVSRAVIPVNDSASGWSYIIGDETPAGGLFSTPSDLLKIGQSMLNHSFLSPLATRKWMKPVAHTADLRWSVGMPWEILRATPGNGTRIVDLYTKAGDLGYYGAVLAIVPDYNAGFVINVAGPNYAALLAAASDIVADIYLPALEQAAKQQALTNFAGTYKSSMMNSTLVLEVDQAKPGVGLTKFISNGTDLLPLLAALYANDGDTLDIRLYPSNLRTPAGNGQTKVPFLALFADADYSTSTGIFASTFSDGTWQVIDEWHYGNVGLDEFLFTLDEGGRAVSVSPRVLRTILGRVA